MPWEQVQSAQVPSQLAPRSVLVCTSQAESRLHSSAGAIGNKFCRPRFPVNLYQGLYLYVLDKPRVDYTLAQEQLVQLADPGYSISLFFLSLFLSFLFFLSILSCSYCISELLIYFYQAAVAIKISMFLFVALICLVLYLRMIILLKLFILYCLVSLNSVLFLTSVCVRVLACARACEYYELHVL